MSEGELGYPASIVGYQEMTVRFKAPHELLGTFAKAYLDYWTTKSYETEEEVTETEEEVTEAEEEVTEAELPKPDYNRPAVTISDISMLRAITVLSLMKDAERGVQDSWAMVPELAGLFDINPKRIRSKMRRMMKRNLIDGCDCGCRGDIYILKAGKELLDSDTSWTRFL